MYVSQISHVYLKQSSLLFGYSIGMVQIIIDKHFLKCLCTCFCAKCAKLYLCAWHYMLCFATLLIMLKIILA